MIAAINGPANGGHAELLLSDVVLVSENFTYRDAHISGGGPPGDGGQLILRGSLGLNRSNYYLVTGKTITAQDALRLGLVGEVLPADRLLPRAWEIAQGLIDGKTRAQRRLIRAVIAQPWREIVVKEMALSMAHETLAGALR